MTRRVLNVGQCVPDTIKITNFLKSSFDVEIVPSATAPETIDLLGKSSYDLVLINRKLDADYTDGLNIIRQMKADERFQNIPVMLVTNYAEYQQEAVATGAAYGFGKDELGSSDAVARLTPYLG
jgi:CheY-like chemotaxis protein